MNETLNDALWATVQLILADAIRVLIPVVIFWIAAQLGGVWKWVKLQIGDQQASMIEQAVALGVKYAEQSGLTAELGLLGEQKMQLALDFAQQWLNKQGMSKIDLDELRKVAEATVIELFPKQNPELG